MAHPPVLDPLASFENTKIHYQALINIADHQEYAPYRDILRNCCGVIFCGVPNQGIRFEELMEMAEGQRGRTFIRSLLLDEDSEISMDLSTLNNGFGRVTRVFGNVGDLNVLCYYETKKTLLQQVSEYHQSRRSI